MLRRTRPQIDAKRQMGRVLPVAIAIILLIRLACQPLTANAAATLEAYGRLPWLSRSETRLQMLKSTVDFLRIHNPPN